MQRLELDVFRLAKALSFPNFIGLGSIENFTQADMPVRRAIELVEGFAQPAEKADINNAEILIEQHQCGKRIRRAANQFTKVADLQLRFDDLIRNFDERVRWVDAASEERLGKKNRFAEAGRLRFYGFPEYGADMAGGAEDPLIRTRPLVKIKFLRPLLDLDLERLNFCFKGIK